MIELQLASNQLRSAAEAETEACTLGGVGHDFRPNRHISYGVEKVSWVCVWCHGVACGGYEEPDPCMEITSHRTLHKSRQGDTWPIGGTRGHEAI